jgi:hypothetical protein
VKGRLGAGERGAIAGALNRGCALAIDDWRAVRRALQEAALGENMLSILRIQDIVVELIRKGVVSVEAADAIHVDWATNHWFKLNIAPFKTFCSELPAGGRAVAYRRHSVDHVAGEDDTRRSRINIWSGAFEPWTGARSSKPMMRPST